MKTRQLGKEAKEEAIRGYYREVEERKYGKGEGKYSSEDVWESREEKVPVGEAFKVRFEAFPGEDDREWNRLERENREKRRQMVEQRGG